MTDNAQQIETFRDFAKEKFQNHSFELDTRYQNRELASDDLKQQAYKEHKKIFQEELSEKIEELLNESNQFLRPALNHIKDKLIEKLTPDVHV